MESLIATCDKFPSTIAKFLLLEQTLGNVLCLRSILKFLHFLRSEVLLRLETCEPTDTFSIYFICCQCQTMAKLKTVSNIL